MNENEAATYVAEVSKRLRKVYPDMKRGNDPVFYEAVRTLTKADEALSLVSLLSAQRSVLRILFSSALNASLSDAACRPEWQRVQASLQQTLEAMEELMSSKDQASET